jgi:hypothetical protein
MTETELLTLVESEEKRSLGYGDGELSAEREKALDYYNSKVYGNEVEGRSQVVSSEVFSTVEWLLPDLLKVFTSSDKAVEFTPERPSDEKGAQQATDTCNYIFYRQNSGFTVLYSFFKDALIQKNGYVKVWYEESEKKRKESYQGLTQFQLTELVKNDNVEVIGVTSYPDPTFPAQPDPMAQAVGEAMQAPMQPPEVYDVQIEVTEKAGKVCVKPLPPEEILVSADQASVELQDCPFVAHRCKRTISQLVEMGYDEKELDSAGYEDDTVENSGEWLARQQFDEQEMYTTTDSASIDPSMRKVWVTEAYIRCDFDGDGVAELRKVMKTGSLVLENEEVDVIPIAAITPIMMTHQHYGKSVAELVMDLQLIKSTLWRQTLDNIYLTNAPRMAVLSTPQGAPQANLDDLLMVRPGGVVREYSPGAVRPLVVPFMAEKGIQMMEYTDTVMENRVGVTRYNQGLDSNTLNKTATGISQIMNASQQRKELIARIFAETGVKAIFKLILHCVSKYNARPMTIRLTDEWVEVDPREWADSYDMMINVGLGSGNKDSQNQQLAMIAEAQFKMLQMGLPIVTPENIYSTQRKIVENAGFKNVEDFWTNPEDQPPQPPQPDPAQMQMQAEQQKAQAEMQMQGQKMQQDSQMKVAQMQQEGQLKAAQMQAELAMERERITAQIELERWKAQQEADLAIFKANLNAQVADRANDLKESELKDSEEGRKHDSEKTEREATTISEASTILSEAAKAIATAAETISRPKVIVRDKNGRAVGVQTV